MQPGPAAVGGDGERERETEGQPRAIDATRRECGNEENIEKVYE